MSRTRICTLMTFSPISVKSSEYTKIISDHYKYLTHSKEAGLQNMMTSPTTYFVFEKVRFT